MCLTRKEEPMQKVQLRLLTFGKNLYGKGLIRPRGQDLRGCVNDTKFLSADMTAQMPGIDCRSYINYDVTAANYKARVREAKALLDPGAAIVVIMDSCFSGTGTRLYPTNPGKVRNRFFDPGFQHIPERVRSRPGSSPEMTWAALSAGGENQTVADAYFKTYEGALTHFIRQTFRQGMTLIDWYVEIRRYLPSLSFDQIPQLEGPHDILNRRIGDGQWLFIHNSSHGSWTADLDGDELDGRDEGIYFDRLLLDDEIRELLSA
jgi:hypothetical protein